MTPDQLAVLRATPSSASAPKASWRIAERAGIEAPLCTLRLLTLKGMGLVSPPERGYTSDWTRTPTGDRVAAGDR